MCDIRTQEHNDGNILEAAKEIKMQDLYDQFRSTRDIIFQVMFNSEIERSVNLAGVKSNDVQSDNRKKNSTKITLSSCFEAFEKEELLTDND